MSEIKITTEKVREAYKKGNDCVKGVSFWRRSMCS